MLSLEGGNVVSADGGSWPLEEVTGLLEDAQILGKGARGPNPTGMRVLTFGIQVADVSVDVETGEVRVDRVAAIHDVGRVINPLGARSQVEGGIIQGVGHTLSEERLVDPASGTVLTQTLDAYKLPTIADVPEIVGRAARHPGPAPDEPRLEGARRAADRAHRGRDRERDPRRDRRRRPLAAGHTGGDAPRAGRGARAREEACGCSGLTRSTARPPSSATARSRSPAAPSSFRSCATGSSRPRRWSSAPSRTPRGLEGGSRIGAGTTLAELESDHEIPRHSARPARWRPRRSCARWGRSGATAPGDALLVLAAEVPVLSPRRRPLSRAPGGTSRARVFGNDRCASAHPSDPAAALLALGATLRTDRRELPLEELYRLPTEDDRDGPRWTRES